MRFLLVLSLLAFGTAPRTLAASFNCTAARTAREHAICGSKELSALDEQLAHAYKASRTDLSPASAALIQGDQQAWLAWLDKVCPVKSANGNDMASCLKDHYNSRLQQLTKGRQSLGGVLFFTRSYFVFAPSKPADAPKNGVPNGPGFGYGEFSWPQVDRPDNDHALWNTAVAAAALRVEGGAVRTNTSFEAAITPDGNQESDYTVFAANDRFLGVDFENFEYEWGGAHGQTVDVSFNWWLDQRRPVVVGDIFAPGRDWLRRLVPLTLARLQAGDDADSLWKGVELTKGVTDGVKDDKSWDLSSEGLTVSFGQYAVAPYAAGMPSVTLSWSSLKPMLAPALRPETLPHRILAAAN